MLTSRRSSICKSTSVDGSEKNKALKTEALSSASVAAAPVEDDRTNVKHVCMFFPVRPPEDIWTMT